MSGYVGFQIRFLRFAQQYDFVRALSDKDGIQRGNPSVTVGDLHRARFSLHRVRRAQLLWTSLLEATGSEAVEYPIDNSMTPAKVWTCLKEHYAPSTSSQIAGIKRNLHEHRMEDNEDIPEVFSSCSRTSRLLWNDWGALRSANTAPLLSILIRKVSY